MNSSKEIRITRGGYNLAGCMIVNHFNPLLARRLSEQRISTWTVRLPSTMREKCKSKTAWCENLCRREMEGISGAGGTGEVVRLVNTGPATSWRNSVSTDERRGVCHHLVSKSCMV